MPAEFFSHDKHPTLYPDLSDIVDTFMIDKVRCGRLAQESDGSLQILPEETVDALLTKEQKNALSYDTQCGLVNLFDQDKKGVVQVAATDGATSVSFGSGAGVSDDEVVTNRHVVEGAQSVFVLAQVKKAPDAPVQTVKIPVQVEGMRGDLALLKLPQGVHVRPMPLGDSSSLKPGSFVMAIGYPRASREPYISPGSYTGTISVAELVQENEDLLQKAKSSVGLATGIAEKQLQEAIANAERTRQSLGWLKAPEETLNMQILPGNSGGPLVDAQGHLVGLVNMSRSNQAQVTERAEAVPVEEIKALLLESRRKFPSSNSPTVLK